MKILQIFVAAAFGFTPALAAVAADPKVPDLGALFASECLADVLGDCPDLVNTAEDLFKDKAITFDTILDKINDLSENPPSNKCKLTLATCVGKVATGAAKEVLGADEEPEESASSEDR